jgi:hypothetical protein
MLASPPIAQRAMKVSGRKPGFLQLNQTAACGGCDVMSFNPRLTGNFPWYFFNWWR